MFPQQLLHLITLPDVTFKLCFAFKALKGIGTEKAFRISAAIPQLELSNFVIIEKNPLMVKKM